MDTRRSLLVDDGGCPSWPIRGRSDRSVPLRARRPRAGRPRERPVQTRVTSGIKGGLGTLAGAPVVGVLHGLNALAVLGTAAQASALTRTKPSAGHQGTGPVDVPPRSDGSAARQPTRPV